jgi:hypothetical protein
MNDVGELVGEDHLQPVIGTEQVGPGRPHRVQSDRVSRQRRGVAVRKLGLVDEYDVRARRQRRAELLRERLPGGFGNPRESSGKPVLTLMK